jgi:hypothetical protein
MLKPKLTKDKTPLKKIILLVKEDTVNKHPMSIKVDRVVFINATITLSGNFLIVSEEDKEGVIYRTFPLETIQSYKILND